MSCVAGEEYAPVAKPVGDQAATGPILLTESLIPEIGIDAENLADAAIAIEGI